MNFAAEVHIMDALADTLWAHLGNNIRDDTTYNMLITTLKQRTARELSQIRKCLVHHQGAAQLLAKLLLLDHELYLISVHIVAIQNTRATSSPATIQQKKGAVPIAYEPLIF